MNLPGTVVICVWAVVVGDTCIPDPVVTGAIDIGPVGDVTSSCQVLDSNVVVAALLVWTVVVVTVV